MNSYGGEEALQNVLFLKTNHILTMLWGILYLFTSVFTWFLMRTPVSSLAGLINSVIPVFMGIFTAWFQKWYPAKVASTALRKFNFAMDFSFHREPMYMECDQGILRVYIYIDTFSCFQLEDLGLVL